MKHIFIIIALLLFFSCLNAQVTEMPVNTVSEQQLESITEQNEDMETEDDSYLQELAQYVKHPVDLNTATEARLSELKMLTPMQIQNFLLYRSMLGKLISIYEMQALPGWDIGIIQKLRLYVTVISYEGLKNTIGSRLKNGDKNLLLRLSQTLEKSKGFIPQDSSEKAYTGSPQKVLLRYKYNYRNLLQYGFTGEKDAGEAFFKKGQRQGFDFYSAHFFIRNAGRIKALAVGDFTVSLGQGLTQWMSLAFKKGPDIVSVKRQSAILKPYNSAGEAVFYRGAGITIANRKIEATFFASMRKTDGNMKAGDSTAQEIVSSLQVSGLHRTLNELEDKGVQRQITFGANVGYRSGALQVGINAVHHHLKLLVEKEKEPYNLYAFNGNKAGNFSVDYSYTYNNMHFFGEAASTNKGSSAFISGLLISVAHNIDMSFVYRNISKSYQSLNAGAFTENSLPFNEKGLFGGISVRPSNSLRIDAYGDICKFPWLKYRINKPSGGSEYFIQVTWKPDKMVELYTRFKTEVKSLNFNPQEFVLSPVMAQPRQNWRTQVSVKLNSSIMIRSRTEAVWFDSKGAGASQGFLFHSDLIYKPPLKPFSGNIRLQYFETDDYNSRIYAYENDVLYSFSIPVLYGKGFRYYLNVTYDITKKATISVKMARITRPGQMLTGSGYDGIAGPHKTDLRMQLFYNF